MRAVVLALLTILSLGSWGCGSYNQVNQGAGGATSPAESGQHGADANQIANSDSAHSDETKKNEKPTGDTMEDKAKSESPKK